VEHDFLISFLNSSIESLEKCTDHEINGIMSKDELLDRLREKKHTMERLYAVGLECNHKQALVVIGFDGISGSFEPSITTDLQ